MQGMQSAHTKGEGDAIMLLALFIWLAGVVGGCSAFSVALAPLRGCPAGVALPGSALTMGASSTFMGSAPSSVLTVKGACPPSITVQPAAQSHAGEEEPRRSRAWLGAMCMILVRCTVMLHMCCHFWGQETLARHLCTVLQPYSSLRCNCESLACSRFWHLQVMPRACLQVKLACDYKLLSVVDDIHYIVLHGEGAAFLEGPTSCQLGCL